VASTDQELHRACLYKRRLIHMIPHKMTNFQLGTSDGAMEIGSFADLCIPNKISKTLKIIQIDVL
jgi:hypothetical protein